MQWCYPPLDGSRVCMIYASTMTWTFPASAAREMTKILLWITSRIPNPHGPLSLLWDWVISVCCAPLSTCGCISACAHLCMCVSVSAGFVHMLLYESHGDKPVKHHSVNTTTLSQSERASERERARKRNLPHASCLLTNMANAANVVYQVHIYLFIMAEVKNTTSCPHCSHDSPQVWEKMS